ncbi:MAG: MogA/MoaB family molybdenum cofactor biosynthesis protein [Elusimicrobia bacterium]|nr:MogA/MoaB family molybdenum cofactor biosynthesis protein [Elusimicrobiota bacterium]
MRVGILSCSTSRAKKKNGQKEDISSKVLQEILKSYCLKGKKVFKISCYSLVPDQKEKISSVLKTWADQEKCDLIFTTGGTGFSQTDCTPEATRLGLEKEAPGLSELIRLKSQSPFAYCSRGICGIRKKSLILNLPGSPQGVEESVKAVLLILPHAIELVNKR